MRVQHNTCIGNGVNLLYSRALRHPGSEIPVVCRNIIDANYYYQNFVKHLIPAHIAKLDQKCREIHFDNGSCLIFPIETAPYVR